MDVGGELSELFTENVVAKVLRVAAKYAKSQNPRQNSQEGDNLDPRGPDTFPEYVPQDGDTPGLEANLKPRRFHHLCYK